MYSLKSFYHLLIRLVVALLASHFVVVHNATETWLELFTRRYYYTSLLYSMVIAFLLIENIYFVSKRVNIFLKGQNNSAKRIKAQFFYGFILTAFHAFLMAMILFWLNGEDIFNSNYFEKLYAFILVFIFAINVVYLFYFENYKAKKTIYHTLELSRAQLINLRIKALKANLPALIFHENKACFAVDFNGVKTSWPNTIEESMKLLHPENYFQISRKSIVHRAAVSSFSAYKTKCLKIELNVECPIELITSRRKAIFFKEWIK